jgi:hypothetical protein
MAIEIVIGPNNLSLDAYKFKMIDFVNYSSIGITISHPGMIAEMKKQIKDTNELPRILMHIESGHGAVEEYFVIDEEASSIGFSKN